MFIHRENALKAHQHISYCSIQRYHIKKKFFLIHYYYLKRIIFFIQNVIKMYTKLNASIMTCFPQKIPRAITNLIANDQ